MGPNGIFRRERGSRFCASSQVSPRNSPIASLKLTSKCRAATCLPANSTVVSGKRFSRTAVVAGFQSGYPNPAEVKVFSSPTASATRA